MPPPVRIPLLHAWRALHFGWAERATRVFLTQQSLQAGDLALGLVTWRSAVEHATAARGRFPLIFALTAYGSLLITGGWFAEGERFLATAEEMTRGWQGNPVRKAVVLGLVRSRASRARLESDEPLFAEFQVTFGRGGAMDRARRLEAKAMLLRGIGNPQEAAVIYREAQEAARRTGQKEVRGAIANNLATVLIDAGDLAGAAMAIEEATSFMGHTSLYLAFLQGTKGELALVQGDLAGAQTALDRSWHLKERGGATGGIGWMRATQGRLAVAKGDLASARSLLAAAAPVLQDAAALRAWERAAAVALPGSAATLCEAPPDPLADSARAAAKPLSKAVGDLEQNLQWGVVISFGVAAMWLTRDIPLWSVGSLLIDVAAVALLVLVGYRYLGGRMAGG